MAVRSLRLRRFVRDHAGSLGAALSLILVAPRADAQCGTWDPAFGVPGANDVVGAFASFDDGGGPTLWAIGSFTSIGGVAAPGLARWTAGSWSPEAIAGTVVLNSLTVLDDGSGLDLYVGGRRFTASFTWQDVVWRRSGGAWTPVGPVASTSWGEVKGVVAFDAGSGVQIFRARHGFSPFGPVGIVEAFDGTSWNLVGSFSSDSGGTIETLAVLDDGSGPALYVGGNYADVWNPAGGFTGAYSLARWRGGPAWEGFALTYSGSPNPPRIYALAGFDDGQGPAVYVGGDFDRAGSLVVNHVARLSNGAWSALGTGTDQGIGALAAFDDGGGIALYVSGSFTTAGGVAATRIARWDGASWSALGAGLDAGGWLGVHDDGADGDDDLYVGGYLASAGGQPSSHLARWIGCGTRAFCFGDGASVACPCANNGAVGGCENSAATGGALLQATGTSHPDALVLTSSGELASALSIFLQGDVAVAPTPFGDGLRCAGGQLKRLYVANAGAGVVQAPQTGDPSITARSAALGDPLDPGDRRFYQVWYRDPDPVFCASPQGSTFNASNALRVSW